MVGTGLQTTQSTHPPLQFYLRFKQGARARTWLYDLNRTPHSIGYKNSRLVLLYSSFIEYNVGGLLLPKILKNIFNHLLLAQAIIGSFVFRMQASSS
jgi:hypothetical protein